MSRKQLRHRREARQASAKVRQAARDKRPTAQQLELIIARPGFSKRETARLTGQPMSMSVRRRLATQLGQP